VSSELNKDTRSLCRHRSDDPSSELLERLRRLRPDRGRGGGRFARRAYDLRDEDDKPLLAFLIEGCAKRGFDWTA
jgi:hypothetical protein